VTQKRRMTSGAGSRRAIPQFAMSEAWSNALRDGFAEEVVPAPGLRVDVMALGPKGEVWVIECKSGPGGLSCGPQVAGLSGLVRPVLLGGGRNFPTEILPEGTGLILADGYDAEIVRMGPETALAPAPAQGDAAEVRPPRRARLQALRDPGVSPFFL
jgi:hypothetical protein